MKHIIIKSLSAILFFNIAATVTATPVLPVIFSDNMVIQQKSDAPIWGKADANKTVTILTSWNNKKVSTMSDADGIWKTTIQTPKAGGPYSITISDGSSITIKNVMSGEVWLCSGQSNMEMPVNGWARVDNFQKEIDESSYSNIRLMLMKQVISNTPSKEVSANYTSWKVCGPTTISDFSAVAYFFARKLNKDLNIPVGVIDDTWGGTAIEAWTSAETLEQKSEFADKTDLKPTDKTDRNSPTVLFNGMISPLIPMAIKGVCWYQGEQNESRGYQYRDLFSMMIRDWRNKWGKELPFYFVQLANYKQRSDKPCESYWAEVREAQAMGLKINATGMVVTADIGDGNNIHYTNKQEVGRRLALVALAKSYGKNIVCSGPLYESYSIDNNKVILSFTHTDGGLKAKDNTLKNFTIAGPDHKFYNAKAIIEGGKVIVSSDKVNYPVAVRYAWQDNPFCDLYNGAGLPASPFRTDDWIGISYNNK